MDLRHENTPTGRYRLYCRPGDVSAVPQMLLEEMQLPHDRIWVGRGDEELTEYRKVNPTGRIPTLILPDGSPMFETAAICIYLPLLHPQSRLAPPLGASDFARFLQWTVFLSVNIYETARRAYRAAELSTEGINHAPGVRAQALIDLRKHLALIDSALSPYLLGPTLSAADIYLYLLTKWYPYPAPPAELLDSLPRLRHLAELIGARPAVQRVLADNQH